MFRLIALVLLTASLTACNTFSKKQCEHMDWAQVGASSANRGWTPGGAIGYFRKECGITHGIHPNFEAFTAGYNQGLERFCTSQGGMRFGSTGGKYAFTCPAEKEKEFLSGYQTGKLDYMGDQLRSLNSEVDRLRSQLSDRESRIRELESHHHH